MKTSNRVDNTELWESGELGRSLEHAQVAQDVGDELDEELGLQMISIRLERSLIKDLKQIAAYHEVGYQPMIRDLLNRFVRSEIQSILVSEKQKISDRIEALKESSSQETTAPVDEFLSQYKRHA